MDIFNVAQKRSLSRLDICYSSRKIDLNSITWNKNCVGLVRYNRALLICSHFNLVSLSLYCCQFLHKKASSFRFNMQLVLVFSNTLIFVSTMFILLNTLLLVEILYIYKYVNSAPYGLTHLNKGVENPIFKGPHLSRRIACPFF